MVCVTNILLHEFTGYKNIPMILNACINKNLLIVYEKYVPSIPFEHRHLKE